MVSTTSELQPAQSPLKAAFWMFGAILSFSAMAVSGRNVSTELDTFELMMYRSFISVFLVISIGGIAGTLGQINTKSFGTHIARNVSHFTGQNLWFAALTMIPMAQVFALEFTSPIWVILLAPLLLGERLTKLRILVALLGFTGVVIVARPDMGNINPGVVMGALSAIGFAGSAIFTKILTRTQTITCILFWLALMQSIFGIVFSVWDGDVAVPSNALMPWVISVSVAGLGAHFCLTKALSLAPAVTVIPFDFARLPLIAIIGAMIYAEPLDLWVFIGAAIIFSANYVNLLATSRANKV
ncbi:MAG: DMT family transporter [Litoreibacter sp.]